MNCRFRKSFRGLRWFIFELNEANNIESFLLDLNQIDKPLESYLEPIRKPTIGKVNNGAMSCHSRMPLAGIHR